MQNKAIDVAIYNFRAEDKILPDANIWLYLYSPAAIAYPPGLQPVIKTYTRAWAILHQKGATVWLDTLVLSEVINRLLDEEWQRIDPPPNQGNQGRKYKNRKEFRRSQDYPPAARSVEAIAKLVVTYSKPLDHSFSNWNLTQLLTEFGSGSTDWNDQLIVETCLHHNVKLLTHDSDHLTGGIEVLTSNPTLLAACS